MNATHTARQMTNRELAAYLTAGPQDAAGYLAAQTEARQRLATADAESSLPGESHMALRLALAS
jgi:hypothetical protein